MRRFVPRRISTCFQILLDHPEGIMDQINECIAALRQLRLR